MLIVSSVVMLVKRKSTLRLSHEKSRILFHNLENLDDLLNLRVDTIEV